MKCDSCEKEEEIEGPYAEKPTGWQYFKRDVGSWTHREYETVSYCAECSAAEYAKKNYFHV